MKSLKWTTIILFGLVVSVHLGVTGGLSYSGCHRLRGICRGNIECDYKVLYQSCRQFMTPKVDDEGDPIPPMSLVKVWLLFPEVLNPYGKRKQRGNRDRDMGWERSRDMGWERNRYSRETDRETDRVDDNYYDEEVIQRVRRVLELLKQGKYSEDLENYENQYAPGENVVNNYKKYGNEVAKSNKEDDGYGLFHLLHQKADETLKNQPIINDSPPSKQQDLHKSHAEIDTKALLLAKTQDSGFLNNHNKEHLTTKEQSEAAASALDVDAKLNEESPSVILSKTQTEKIGKKANVVVGSHKSNHFYPSELKDARDLEQDLAADPERGTLILQFSESVKPETLKTVSHQVQKVLWGIDSKRQQIFTKASIDPKDNKKVQLYMHVPHSQYNSAFDPALTANRINTEEPLRKKLSTATGLNLLHAKSPAGSAYQLPKDKDWDEFAIITAIVGGCTLALIVSALIICSIKRKNSGKIPVELHKKEALTDYEELCRTQMALNPASPGSMKALNADKQRHGLVNGQGKYTKKTWREEPLAYNMDISTGHVILAYMEDHLKNEDKLSQEWEALCNYKADQNDTTAGEDSKNANKNRYSNVLPYDHTRVKLRETSNVLHSDYINASFITDADPRNPAYIATQGPLDNTIADFWQMIWEQGVVVIVNLTRLSDMGLPQCQRYWPEEGNEVYNTYQVHLISEHIWCDDYIVRSFYLKHLATQETRTITQFHYLTWPDLSVPESAKPLLEFRRKVNKCYRGQACPIVIHCNNGVGRTGTYILVDMVLKKMIKGTKEIDIAATLEYLRDQRPDMVKTKAQFEFSLTAVAEEVTAILSSLSN